MNQNQQLKNRESIIKKIQEIIKECEITRCINSEHGYKSMKEIFGETIKDMAIQSGLINDESKSSQDER